MVKLIFLCRRRPDLTPAAYAERLAGHVPLALRHHPTMQGYVVNVVESGHAALDAIDSIGELSFASLADYQERLYGSPEGRVAIERDVAGFLGGAAAYVTTPHLQLDVPQPATPPGERSPGVKLVCPVQRRSDLSHEAFVAHWFGTHVPLARVAHPGLTRYVTNVVEQRLGNEGEEWDGFTELHFASAASIAGGLFASPEHERAIREDIAKFIGRTGFYRVAEHVQKPCD